MATYPTIPNSIEMLRLYQGKKGWSNETLAESLTIFGWDWSEDHMAALMAGRKKPSGKEKIFIQRYLLQAYHAEDLS